MKHIVNPLVLTNFPLLAQSTNSIEIVIFVDANTGYVLVAGDAQRPVGYIVDDHIYDEDDWRILPLGTQVILTQS